MYVEEGSISYSSLLWHPQESEEAILGNAVIRKANHHHEYGLQVGIETIVTEITNLAMKEY